MRFGLLCVVVSLACSGGLASAQTGDEQAMRAVVQAETKAWIDRNADAWKATWLQDGSASRAVVQAGSYTSQQGWENIAAPMMKDFKDNPVPLPYSATMAHFVARQQGNLAVVEYDQGMTATGQTASGSPSREYRVLQRTAGGEWKIASQITHVVDSFGDTPEAIGDRVNGTGQALLRTGHAQDALEIFKMNVRLSPQSTDAFYSLGEGYAATGGKDLAVQSYKKSLQLDPKNENARLALARLKKP
jgi:tetratricopeptide (TPR) repeat protein